MPRALAAAISFLLLSVAAYADGPVRLKTRLLDSNSAGPPITGRHFIVQFGHYPAAETRSALEGRGMRVLGYVPDFALMVSADNPPDLDGLDVTWKGSLAAGDKLSPELSTGPRNAFLVMMQADVSRAAARELLLSRGFFLLDQPGLLPAHYVVLGSYRALYELAASDEVAYILPPSPDLLSGQPVMACAGPLTEAGPIGQYVTVGSGWVKDSTGSVNLNYAFESLNARLDSNTQQSEILRALAQWAAYANIRLSAGTGSGARTVDIKFASGSHGDAYPFYPSGTVLAHTFYPVPLNPEPIAGDMHLNADENWKIGATLDVFSVALHEAGHALGLGHTDKPDSVMYPYYHLVTALSADDIAGVQALYGSKAPVGPPTPPPTPSPSPAPTPEPSPTPTPGPPDQTPPSLAITSPGSSIVSTYTDSITVSGTASDNVGVTAVRWSTSNGFSGTANGTNTWSAMVPLLVGNNVITVRAYDAAGNSGWRALTVVRH